MYYSSILKRKKQTLVYENMFDFIVDKHAFVIYNLIIAQTFVTNRCSMSRILAYNYFL